MFLWVWTWLTFGRGCKHPVGSCFQWAALGPPVRGCELMQTLCLKKKVLSPILFTSLARYMHAHSHCWWVAPEKGCSLEVAENSQACTWREGWKVPPIKIKGSFQNYLPSNCSIKLGILNYHIHFQNRNDALWIPFSGNLPLQRNTVDTVFTFINHYTKATQRCHHI